MATESRAPTVNDVIDGRPVSRFQATTILLCGLVLLLDGFDTQAMGFLVPPIAEELGLPLSAFGAVLSAGLFGLMLGAMGSGPIADRGDANGPSSSRRSSSGSSRSSRHKPTPSMSWSPCGS